MTTTWDDLLAPELKAGARLLGRARWRESDHPRDRLGRFIETGSEVRLLGGATATVVGRAKGDRITVRRTDNGQTYNVDRGSLTVTKRPDGAAPTADPQQVAAITDDGDDALPDAPEEDVTEAPAAPATPARRPAPQLTVKPHRDGSFRVTDDKGEQVGRFDTVDEANAYIQRAAAREARSGTGVDVVRGGRRDAEAIEGPSRAQAGKLEERRRQLLDEARRIREHGRTVDADQREADAADIEADLRKYGYGKLIGAPEKDKKPAAGTTELTVDAAELRVGDKLTMGGKLVEVTDVQHGDSDSTVSLRGRRGQVRLTHGTPRTVQRPADAPETPTIDPKLAREQAYARMEHPERVSFKTVDELREYLRGGAMHAAKASAQNVLDEIADDPTLKLVPNSLGGLATRGKGKNAQLIHTRSGAFILLAADERIEGGTGRAKLDRIADALIGESISWRDDWGLEGHELVKRHPDLRDVVGRAIGWVNDDSKPDPDPAPDPAPPAPPVPDGTPVEVAPGGYRVGGRVEVEEHDFTAPGQPRRWFPGEVTAIHATGGIGTGRASQYDVSVRTEDGRVSVHRVGARGGNNRIRVPADPDTPPPPRGNYFEGAETGRVAEPPKVTVGPARGGGDRVVTVEYDGQTQTLTTRREFSHVAIASFTKPDGTNGLWLTLTRSPESALREIRKHRDWRLAEGYRKFTLPWAYPMDAVVPRAEDEKPAPPDGSRGPGTLRELRVQPGQWVSEDGGRTWGQVREAPAWDHPSNEGATGREEVWVSFGGGPAVRRQAASARRFLARDTAPDTPDPTPAPRRVYDVVPAQLEAGDTVLVRGSRGAGGEFEVAEIVDRTDSSTTVRWANAGGGQMTYPSTERLRIARAADRPEPTPVPAPDPTPTPDPDPAPPGGEGPTGFRHPAYVSDPEAFGTPDAQGRITGAGAVKPRLTGYLTRDQGNGQLFLISDPRMEPGEDGTGLYPDIDTGTAHRFDAGQQRWVEARRPRNGLGIVSPDPADVDPLKAFDYTPEQIEALGKLAKPWTPTGRAERHYINNWASLVPWLKVTKGRWANRRQVEPNYYKDTRNDRFGYDSETQRKLNSGRVWFENGKLVMSSEVAFLFGPDIVNSLHERMGRDERIVEGADGRLTIRTAGAADPDPVDVPDVPPTGDAGPDPELDPAAATVTRTTGDRVRVEYDGMRGEVNLADPIRRDGEPFRQVAVMVQHRADGTRRLWVQPTDGDAGLVELRAIRDRLSDGSSDRFTEPTVLPVPRRDPGPIGGDVVGRFSEQGDTTPTIAPNLRVGQVVVRLSGTGDPPRYFEVTREWTRASGTIGWRERVPGAAEETIEARSTSMYAVADNPPPPRPEAEELPEHLDRINPPTEDTGPTILARRLKPGDRVRQAAEVFTVIAVEPGESEDNVAVTVEHAGVRSVEVMGAEAILDWADDSTLPTIERHARDINARRPPLYTYQRRRLVALGLDYDDDPLVAAAATRVRLRQPLSVEEARALATRLRSIADGERRQPQQRAYRRIADVMDATAVESGSVDASGRFDVAARPIRGSVADLTIGDQVAFVNLDGQTVGGFMRGIRTTMGGRLVEIMVEGEGGAGVWHTLTRGTTAWRLPDLPPPVHIPEPPKRRKLREHITADRLGEGDIVSVMENGQLLRGKVIAPHVTGNGTATFWLVVLGRDGMPRASTNVVVRPGDGGPNVVRHSRGDESQGQSWDSVLPDERRRKVPASRIGVGDRIEWTPPDGSGAKIVTVTRVNEALAPDGDVVARTFLFRDDHGDGGSDIHQPDDDVTLAAAADEDARAAMTQALAERAVATRRKRVADEIDGTYNLWMERIRGEIVKALDGEGQDLLDAVDRALDADRETLTDRARTLVGRVRGADTYAMQSTITADDPDVVAVRAMLDGELTRIAAAFRESVQEMPAFPDEDADGPRRRVLHQWRSQPPSQRRNSEAMARALIAGHELTSQVRPQARAVARPRVEGDQLSTRMAAYRAALPDDLADLGNVTVRRAAYARLDPAELERGLLPSIAMSNASGMDVARDGGPGEAAMTHLAIVQAAGRELADEYERRIAGLPSQQEADAARWGLEARQRERDETKRVLDSVTKRAHDQLAEAHGFRDWDEAVAVKNKGPVEDRGRNGDPRWGAAFDAHMQIYDKVHGDPAVKRLRNQLHAANLAVKTAQGRYDAAWSKGAAARRDAALALLAELRPMGGKGLSYVDADTGRSLMGQGTEQVAAMKYAEKHYPTDWLELIDQAKDGKPWKLGVIDRGNHSWGTQTINLSRGPEKVPGAGKMGDTALHELGHGMEKAIPGLAAMERAYLWARSADGEVGDRQREAKRSLVGHGGASHDEKAYHDEFKLAYSGKDYGTPGTITEAYEVFTTGVESMFGGSDYVDDDFRAWMFGTMALLGEPNGNRAAEFTEERRAEQRTRRRAAAEKAAKDPQGVPWRLTYEYLARLNEEELDSLTDYLAQGLSENDPRELARWEDFEAYSAAQEGVDDIVSGARGLSDDEITAEVESFLATHGRPGLTHPRVGGTSRANSGRPTKAQVQDEYATFLEVQYLDAETATSGSLLNARGQRDRINPRDLFTGDVRQVYRYASEELLAYWENTRRVGWSEYYYERTRSPGAARAAQRQAEQNARINRDRTEAGSRTRAANRTRRSP